MNTEDNIDDLSWLFEAHGELPPMSEVEKRAADKRAAMREGREDALASILEHAGRSGMWLAKVIRAPQRPGAGRVVSSILTGLVGNGFSDFFFVFVPWQAAELDSGVGPS